MYAGLGIPDSDVTLWTKKTGMLVQFCIENFEGKRVSWLSSVVGIFHEKIIKCTEFFRPKYNFLSLTVCW